MSERNRNFIFYTFVGLGAFATVAISIYMLQSKEDVNFGNLSNELAALGSIKFTKVKD